MHAFSHNSPCLTEVGFIGATCVQVDLMVVSKLLLGLFWLFGSQKFASTKPQLPHASWVGWWKWIPLKSEYPSFQENGFDGDIKRRQKVAEWSTTIPGLGKWLWIRSALIEYAVVDCQRYKVWSTYLKHLVLKQVWRIPINGDQVIESIWAKVYDSQRTRVFSGPAVPLWYPVDKLVSWLRNIRFHLILMTTLTVTCYIWRLGYEGHQLSVTPYISFSDCSATCCGVAIPTEEPPLPNYALLSLP